VGSAIPTWEDGRPQTQKFYHNFYRYALDGYGRSEIAYTCIEELATSAAEPRLVVVRKRPEGKTEQLHEHPVLDLFERPNPFTSRYQLIANLIMYRAVGGNAYLNVGRSAAGKAVELWPLRPDRVFVIPDRERYIGAWEYRLENQSFLLRPEDVIQTKTRNPLDEWYGLPPLAVCAERVDTDAMMRSFTLAFFRNAGVPAGLLNITKQVTAAERQLIRDKLRGETGGPQNWHQMLVLDNTEATYTPMGMALGSSGIVLPELDEISEARIAQVFGIPLELIGARLGMLHGNRSTMDAARAHFWQETLSPLYQELAADLTRGLQPEYDGTPDAFDYLEFDLSTVKALQEDEDKKHSRIRSDVAAGILSVQEARVALGHEPEYAPDALLMLARGLEPMTAETALEGGPPDAPTGAGVTPQKPPALAAAGASTAQNGNGNGHKPPGSTGNGGGRLSEADMARLKELAAGRDG
jgi:HK97 family phage portal protein